MTCDDVATATPDYLTGDLDPKDLELVQAHLASCASCRREAEGLSETWTRLGVLSGEAPSGRLREEFYAMLEAYPRDTGEPFPAKRLRVLLSPRWASAAWRGVAAAAILALGVALGVWLKGALDVGQDLRVARMGTEIDSLRQQVSLALMGQGSAGERLRGVALVSRVKEPDSSLLEGLLDVVDNDPNVNVRLSAVDALYLFAGHPQIRQGLTRSLGLQTSPVVQIALIDLLVSIREKRAAEALKDLVNDQRVRPEVRQRALSGIEKLL
jgi:predicted anti-sigma-YlaC factor YlaD